MKPQHKKAFWVLWFVVFMSWEIIALDFGMQIVVDMVRDVTIPNNLIMSGFAGVILFMLVGPFIIYLVLRAAFKEWE